MEHRSFQILPIVKIMLCFAMILSFGSVLAVFFPYRVEFLTALLTIVLMILNKSYIIDGKLVQAVVISYVILIISMFATGSSFNDYKILFVRILLTVLIITAFRNNYSEIAKSLIKVLWIIMVLASVNFVLTMIAPSLFSVVEAEDGYSVMSISYVFNMLAKQSILGVELIRNQSIFWEPGILQIGANFLIYYIIIEQNKPISKAIFPILIVLTTVSTTGFITLAFLLCVKMRKVFSFTGRGLQRTLIVMVVVGFFLPVLYGEIMNKFTGEAKASSTLRLFDLYMGLSLTFNNPIVGIGMNQEKMTQLTGANIIEVNGENMQTERGNTNSIIIMLVKLGIPITAVILLGMYKQSLFSHRFCFFLILLLSLFSEPLFSSYLVLLLTMSSIRVPINNHYGAL